METCRIAEPYAPKDHQRNLGTDQNRVGSWINLREIARKMGIAEGTVLAHAKRHGWTQQIQAATREVTVMQLDAITAVQSVPQSLAAIMADRKQRTKLGLSKDAAEAADQAAEDRDKLRIAGERKDVARIHKTLWPDEKGNKPILNIGILTRKVPVYDSKTGEVFRPRNS
jgi:hypothetical protein